MRTLRAAGLLTFVVLVLMSGRRPGAQTPAGLVGSWLAKEGQLNIALVINADGTGRLDDAAIRYVVTGNTLTVTEDGGVNRYTFALNGNSLVLSGADLDRPMAFERQGGAASSGLGARRSRAADAGGQAPGAANAGSPNAGTPDAGPPNAGRSPIGTWETPGPSGPLRLSLRADGTGTFGSGTVRWQYSQGVLVITGPNGAPVTYNAAFSGDSMTVTGGGMTEAVVFREVPAGMAGAAPTTGGQAPGAANAGPPNAGRGPIGTWETPGPNGPLRLSLRADGTGLFGSSAVRWQYSQGVLILTGPNGASVTYNAAFSGDSMTVTGGGMAETVVFRAVPAGMAGAAPMTGGAPGSARGPEPTGGGQSSGGLVGNWQGPQGLVQIKADGTMLIQGTPYRYVVQGNTMMLVGNDGTLPIPFQLSGDTLTVSLSGQVATLTRTAADAPSAMSGGGGAGIAELAGKWCYFSSFSANSGGGSMTDECFTISPNGTYSYHREGSITADAPGIHGGTASQTDDRGTVQVQGSTLIVNSQSSGPSSYTFVKRNHEKNGDAMLCLDGRCFVTAYQRPPWR